MVFWVILGAVGIGIAISRGVTDYRQSGTITWGWALVGLVFLVMALRPIVQITPKAFTPASGSSVSCRSCRFTGVML